MLILALLLATPSAGASVDRIAAVEADQGVAAGSAYVYAISNHAIGKYDKATGKRVNHWEGDPQHFRHMNSCAIVRRDLVCAASNYPDVPQRSMIETFDADTLRHIGTRPLDGFPGSLTVLTRHGGRWWAIFANYDGKGGDPGRDHRATVLVELDNHFREKRRFPFPDSVLHRFAPKSCSGAQWGKDGMLYVTGHDRPELYALRVPRLGSTLTHVATYATPTNGQGIDWDPLRPGTLWSIERSTHEMVASIVDVRQPLRPE